MAKKRVLGFLKAEVLVRDFQLLKCISSDGHMTACGLCMQMLRSLRDLRAGDSI